MEVEENLVKKWFGGMGVGKEKQSEMSMIKICYIHIWSCQNKSQIKKFGSIASFLCFE